MEEKGTMHVHLLTELTGNLYSEESEWEKDWSESDEYGMPLDGTELADYEEVIREELEFYGDCLLYTSPRPRDGLLSRMPSSA